MNGMSEEKKPIGSGNQEQLFEIIIPPGIPSKVIIAASKKFNLDVVKISANIETAFDETVTREVLGFRADKETIEKIREFLIEETRKFIEE